MSTPKRKPATKPVTKAAAAETAEVKAVVEKVSKVKVPDILQSLVDLQREFTTTVGMLHGTVAEKFGQFESVDIAIAAQNIRLSHLYGIEAEAASFEEIKANREALEAQVAEEQAEKERNRQREEAEFVYNRDLDRLKEKDIYDRTRATRDDALNAREQAIHANEEELKDLRNQVRLFPDLLNAEAGKVESIVSNRLNTDHDHEMALLRAQNAGDRKLAEQTIQTLKEANERLVQQLAAKDQQVALAVAEVSKIASKSVEGAGAQQALAALRDTFQNQSGQKPAARS